MEEMSYVFLFTFFFTVAHFPPGGRSHFSLETLRSTDATATRTSLKNWICVLSVFIVIIPTHLLRKWKRTLLKLNSKGPYPSSEREIKFRRCLFTFSIKREIRHLHVVVVLKRQRKCTKKCNARAKLLFCLLNLLFFTFSLRSRRWILKSLFSHRRYKISCCSSKKNMSPLFFLSRSSPFSSWASLACHPTFSFSLSLSLSKFQICGHEN